MLREVLQRAKQEEPEKDKAAVAAAIEKANAAKTLGEKIAAWRAALRAGVGWRSEEQSMEEARAAIRTILQEGGAEMLRILRGVRDVDGQRRLDPVQHVARRLHAHDGDALGIAELDRAQVLRALIEGVALEMRLNLHILDQAGLEIPSPEAVKKFRHRQRGGANG